MCDDYLYPNLDVGGKEIPYLDFLPRSFHLDFNTHLLSSRSGATIKDPSTSPEMLNVDTNYDSQRVFSLSRVLEFHTIGS